MRKELWGVTNTSSRGPRGYSAKVEVGKTYVAEDGEPKVVNKGDSHLAILDFYLPAGEKGENGKVQDVMVDEVSVVDSEGIAWIEIPEVDYPVKDVLVDDASVVDGEGIAKIVMPEIDYPVEDVKVNGESVVLDKVANIEIIVPEDLVKDVKVNGESVVEDRIASIEIPEDKVQDVLVDGESVVEDGIAKIVMPEVPEVTIGEAGTVTIDLGGYKTGDYIGADAKIADIIKKILFSEAPVPPAEKGKTFIGVIETIPPTEIPASFDMVEYDEKPASITKYFTTTKQVPYSCVCYPAEWGSLSHIIQSDMFDVMNSFDNTQLVKDGVSYKVYYCNSPAVQSNSKYEFKF